MLKAIAFIFLWSLSHLVAADQNYPFYVRSTRFTDHHSLVAVNDGPALITAVIHINGDNIKTTLLRHHVVVVPPHTSREIGILRAANPQFPHKFKFNYEYNTGNVYRHPDAHLYRMPFYSGTKTRVIQSADGRITTHHNPHNRNAIDFSSPENTAVLASRAGVVIEVKNAFTEGGFRNELRDRANLVKIQHADGTSAVYVHLAKRHNALVAVGDYVNAGQLIGFSGNTGYSSGPHLHFGLNRLVLTSDFQISEESVPVSFDVGRLFQGKAIIVANDHQTLSPRPSRLQPSPDKKVLTVTDEIVITINLKWLRDFEEKTGYPWWTFVGIIVSLLLLLLCLRATHSSRKPEYTYELD
jgi:murein DD-endopeptidase MepM/ murein hydrolase activator NlpD